MGISGCGVLGVTKELKELIEDARCRPQYTPARKQCLPNKVHGFHQ